MKPVKTYGLVILLLVSVLLTLTAPAFAAERGEVLGETADFLLTSTSGTPGDPTTGDWTALALARTERPLPERYAQEYLAAVAVRVRAADGVLDARKYTEYSRAVLTVSALGGDARNVAGYDLTAPLGDFDGTVRQGLNGAVFALLALDCRTYPMPENARATRQMYIDYILDKALPDGGWNFMCDPESPAEPDMTGMALQALAPYRKQPEVSAAVEAALTAISALQTDSGGFISWGSPNLEGSAQMLIALCTLGISPEDPRFVKNGKTMEDDLLTFYTSGKGFAHSADSTGKDLMASEQALQALAALERAKAGKPPLFQMTDVRAVTLRAHPDVKVPDAQRDKAGFPDVSGEGGAAIETLAVRGIVSGMGDGRFHPDEIMTRAQFAAIVVRALGLTPETGTAFRDVPSDRWYAPYVGTAARYGIIHGRGDGVFDPEGTITKQEAGILMEQAAALCGAPAVDAALRGSDPVTRGEMARAVCGMLRSAGLV